MLRISNAPGIDTVREPFRPRFAAFWHRCGGLPGFLLALFAVVVVLAIVRVWWVAAPWGASRWANGWLLLLATGAVTGSLARQLPGQNVLLVTLIIGGIGAMAHTLGARTGIPFGPFLYTANLGPELWPGLPWAVPLIWVTVVLTARGVGRLILRPWRKSPTYGFRLIGLTTALTMVFVLSLDPFATVANRYWLWQPSKSGFGWYGAPWVNFLGWSATTLLVLAFATPSLIDKKPGTRPPAYSPLVIWLLLHALFFNGAIAHRLWGVAVAGLLMPLLVSACAWRGARW